MYCVRVDNLDDWRDKARSLLQRGVAPTDVAWEVGQASSLFDAGEDYLSLDICHQSLNIPKDFFALAKQVACFRDDAKWSLLYSVAWRLIFENRRLLEASVDDQVGALLAMRKAIGRDKHKMEAFVRFKKVSTQHIADLLANYEARHIPSSSIQQAMARPEKERVENLKGEQEGANNTPEYFVAWFEPDHLIMPLAASFFVKRFNNMCWSILTPDCCAHWDTQRLIYTPGMAKPIAIDDDLETLWLEYYKHIFNPARLKIKAMCSEMPKKYWVNLPEAPLIKQLIRSAASQTDTMITQAVSEPWDKTARSRFVQQQQEKLRQHQIE